MARYIVVNRHEPQECEPMEAPMGRLPEHLRGKEFICTCPEGPHGFYMLLDGETAEQVIQGLPAEWQKGTTAHPVETFTL